MKYMTRKLNEGYKKWGLAINLEKIMYIWEKGEKNLNLTAAKK
jgi:hypothetical protein